MSFTEFLAAADWTAPPVSHEVGDDGRLRITAAEGSDAWRTTSYGFIHDDAHAALTPLANRHAVEVTFVLDFDQQFDQAGVMVRVNEETWIKAGVEVADGVAQVGAVVTRGVSDWSAAPVPQWVGKQVTVRASRSGDAVTIRARAEGEPWQLVRVAPLDPAADARAGLFCAAPTRAGLTVTFTAIEFTEADASLH